MQTGRTMVIGGTGFIGSHLTEYLLRQGVDVTVAVRDERSRMNPNLADVKDMDNLHFREMVLEEEHSVAEGLQGVDTVYYLAAHTSGLLYSSQHHAAMFYKNLRPFISVLEGARMAGVKRFLVCSSACVYPADAPTPIREEEGFRGFPQETNEGYGMAKRMEEYAATLYAKEYGFPAVIARPFNAYGPRDNFDPNMSHVIPALIRKISQAGTEIEVWGSGDARRAFLFVDDFVRGLVAVVDKAPIATPINIGPDESIAIRELASLVARLSGRPDLNLRFNDARPQGQKYRVCDTTRAKTLLGYKAETTMEDGLKKTIDWFRMKYQ